MSRTFRHLLRRTVCLSVMGLAGHVFAQPATDAAQIERGHYLATAGDCTACHTADLAKPMAGGVPIPTPFGQIIAANITPDPATGIGAWTDEQFYRAMHEGVGRHGENLYPAFPYDAFTHLSRDDVLAIKAYLFSLPPIRQVNPASKLGFPFNQRWILSGWKLLNFRKGAFKPDPGKGEPWNRGAYLVEALAHCSSCHTPRNFSMGSDDGRKFAGGAVGSWQAYNITPDPVSGIGGWSDEELVAYLHTGMVVGKSAAAGGMAEAVEHSLSKLPERDLHDIVAYLRSQRPIRDPAQSKPRYGWGEAKEDISAFRGNENLDHPDGRTLFYGACASCHGASGSGTGDHAFPSLFANTVTGAANANNLVMAIVDGVQRKVGEQAVSMPAFGNELSSAEVASIANYVLKTYGNPAVATLRASDIDVLRKNTGEQPVVAKLALPGIVVAGILMLMLLLWLIRVFIRRRSRR